VQGFLCEEGVFQVMDLPAVGVRNDLDDVEARDDLGVVEHLEPLLCSAHDGPFLSCADRFLGSAEGFVRTCFDLYEYKFRPSAHSAHQVHLATMNGLEVSV
jgi:hypothetical protein